MPCPTPTHMEAIARRRAGAFQMHGGGKYQSPSTHSQRMTQGDGAAVGVHLFAVVS